MVTRLTLSIITLVQVHRAANSPLRIKRSPLDLGSQPVLYSTLHNTGTHVIPVFAQNTGAHSVTQSQHIVFKNNGHNVPLLAPIPLSQYYFHSKLHVIPRQNIIQSAIDHVTKDNANIPLISHHSVSHTSPNANVTHSTSVIPVYIPIHRHLVPVHDLSVIPLHRHHKVEKIGHYRVEKNKEEDDEPSNQYRKFYGGHGAGLFYGGHGSGHGFYAYGK